MENSLKNEYKIEKVLNPDESLIPHGPYCYSLGPATKNGGFPTFNVCPFWNRDDDNEIVYCSYLGKKDGDDGVTLLFDQVKECMVNDNED